MVNISTDAGTYMERPRYPARVSAAESAGRASPPTERVVARPRLPRRPPAGALRAFRPGPPAGAEQADLPGHRHHAHRRRLPGPRRRRQDLPAGPGADHARAQGAGIDAGQPRRPRGAAPAVGALRRHGGAVRGDRRPHHAAGTGRARRARRRRRGRPELPVRPAGRADVRAVGRRGRARLAGQGADDSAAHRHANGSTG